MSKRRKASLHVLCMSLAVRQQLWFQYDINIRNYIHNHWFGRGGPVYWSPRSPDLTPIDFLFAHHYFKGASTDIYLECKPDNEYSIYHLRFRWQKNPTFRTAFSEELRNLAEDSDLTANEMKKIAVDSQIVTDKFKQISEKLKKEQDKGVEKEQKST